MTSLDPGWSNHVCPARVMLRLMEEQRGPDQLPTLYPSHCVIANTASSGVTTMRIRRVTIMRIRRVRRITSNISQVLLKVLHRSTT
jgi:hypothetical protein